MPKNIKCPSIRSFLCLITICTALYISSFSVKAHGAQLQMPGFNIDDSRFTEGQKLLQSGQLDKAVAAGEEWLAKEPSNLNAHLLILLAHLGKGQDELFFNKIDKIIDTTPSSRGTLLGLKGLYYAKKNRVYLALQQYEESLKIEYSNWVAEEAVKLYIRRNQSDKAKNLMESIGDELGLSILYLEQRECAKAIEHAELFLKTHPNNTRPLHIIASCSLLEGQYDRASKAYKEIEKRSSDSQPLTSYYLGLIALISGKQEDANDIFEIALKRFPRVRELNLVSAYILLKNGNFELAKERVNTAIEVSPNDFLGHLILAHIFLAQDKTDFAIEEFAKSKTLFPEFSKEKFYSEYFFSNDNHTEGELFLYFNLLYREGLFDIITTSLSHSDNPFINVTIARSYLKKGSLKKAKTVYRSVLQKHKNFYTAYMELAAIEGRNGNIKEAISLYSKAVATNPEEILPFLSLGSLYYKNNEFELATEQFKKAIQIDSKSPIAYNQLSWTLSEKLLKHEEALQYAQKGSKIAPNYIKLQDTLGWIYFRLDRPEEALLIYKDLQNRKISTPTILYHIGMIYDRLGELAKSAHFFEKSLDLSDSFQGAQIAMQKFEERLSRN